MSLDLFASNIDDAVAYAGRVSAPELPSTFSENIDDAFSKGRLVSQSISGNLRKSQALSDYMDEVRAKTGDPLQLPETASIEDMNAKVRTLKAGNPALDISELTDEDIQRRADEIGVRQLADSTSLARRERTTGGAVGSFLGTAGAALTDPVNMVAFPLAAPESLGILGTALAWGAIGAGSQAGIEALNASSMERIQPGYSTSGEPVTNILEAGGFAGLLGGGLKGLSSLWQRQKSGAWPRTVRDAGNVVDSEVQIASTNPLPGVEGEATHRTALNKAIDDLANGRPVDVDGIVPPEMAVRIDEPPPSVGPDLVLDQMSKKYGPETSMDAWAPEDRQRYFRAIDQDAAAKAVSSIDGRWTPDAAGAEADVFFHGDFAVRRMRDEADALPERPQSAHVLQSVSRDAERQAEVLPFVKDVDYLKAFDPAEARGLVDGLQRDGLMIIDDGAANFGHHDGRLVVVDPGSVVPIPTKAELSQGKYPPAEWKEFVHTAKQYGVDLKPAQTPYPPAQPELALTPPAAREPAKPAGPNAEAVKALDGDLTPAKIEEARAHPDMEETVARDLDKLMLERPDMEVPTGVTVDAEGRTVSTSRKVEDVVAEADARSAAAKEIEACVGPYPASEAA